MQFLIYRGAGEARLPGKMLQTWTPQISNHFQSSWGGWLSHCPSLSMPTLPMPRLLLDPRPSWGRSRRGCKVTKARIESAEREPFKTKAAVNQK